MGMFYGHNRSNQSVAPIITGYGYLYNWYAASDANFAPVNWKVPTKSELDTLVNNYPAGSEELKYPGTDFWNTDNGVNDTLFSWVGNGARAANGTFSSLKDYGYLHGSDEDGSGNTPIAYLADTNTTTLVAYASNFKKGGAAIRLLWDNSPSIPNSTVTDNDGNIYDVVQIGTQYWTVQNWKCTTLDNGDPIPLVSDSAAWAGLSTLARCEYGSV